MCWKDFSIDWHGEILGLRLILSLEDLLSVKLSTLLTLYISFIFSDYSSISSMICVWWFLNIASFVDPFLKFLSSLPRLAGSFIEKEWALLGADLSISGVDCFNGDGLFDYAKIIPGNSYLEFGYTPKSFLSLWCLLAIFSFIYLTSFSNCSAYYFNFSYSRCFFFSKNIL